MLYWPPRGVGEKSSQDLTLLLKVLLCPCKLRFKLCNIMQFVWHVCNMVTIWSLSRVCDIPAIYNIIGVTFHTGLFFMHLYFIKLWRASSVTYSKLERVLIRNWYNQISYASYDINRERNKPQHDKTNKMTCAPSEDSDQPGHSPSLIRVFAWRSMGSQECFCGQRRLWSDWQMPRLIGVFARRTGHFVGFVMLRLK